MLETKIQNFFKKQINEERDKITKLESYLSETNIDKEISLIDTLWYNEVEKHKTKKSKLKLIIIGEAPVSSEKYFYNKQGTFLNSLKEFWELKHNKQLPKKMVENRVLLLDIYKYPLPPEFYKNDNEKILFDEVYIKKKIEHLYTNNLIDEHITLSVFRYKQLFDLEQKLGLNFLKDNNELVSLNESEIPQKLNASVKSFLAK